MATWHVSPFGGSAVEVAVSSFWSIPPPANLTPPPANLTPPPANLTPPPSLSTPPPANLTPPPANFTPPPEYPNAFSRAPICCKLIACQSSKPENAASLVLPL